MAGLTLEDAAGFWRRQLPGLADGEKQLLVAEEGGVIVGTILLMLAQQPNAPHRAEIGKMLVQSSQRRRGLGRRLLAAAESAARGAGRTLLMLDTESGSAGEHLYKACGWTEFGRVPDHSHKPDGPLAETTFFYKRL
ncbi:GNAT family N-acetyltransferase [Zavarzinia aquatilis]|uniref:GNAT family N-acetyltransferase n=2 Tax=Zavarzinia aquatilis TaxID=2211142 RepID=A0A317EGB8_9PROT|nr:GNAT family N-acetyltransferase [Zavarzinia aquatilis]